MEKFDLEMNGLTHLTKLELSDVSGGNWFTYIAEKILDHVIGYVISGQHAKDLAAMGPEACDAAMMYN